jgi:hypothetical protein
MNTGASSSAIALAVATALNADTAARHSPSLDSSSR